MEKTLTKNEKFVLDVFDSIKSGYQVSDDVEPSKVYFAITWFFDKIINNVKIQRDSKLIKSINKHNHILTGLDALYVLKNEMQHELDDSIKIGLINSQSIVETAKQINRLAFMSGGALHELTHSYYIYEYDELRRATFKDLNRTMKAVTKDIKD